MDTDVKPLVIRELGQRPYLEVWQAMQQFTDARDEHSLDQLWFLQHDPVFTQGQAGKAEHILAAGDIPIVKVDRGGQVTYHGPGQQMVYVLLDLKRRKMGVRQLVTLLEQVLIDSLAAFAIQAYAKPDAPGVYVAEKKIASLGLRIRKGCSFHGLALNVDMDLSPFLRINPCGYAGLQMIQCRDFGSITMSDIKQQLIQQFTQHLHCANVLYKTELDWQHD